MPRTAPPRTAPPRTAPPRSSLRLSPRAASRAAGRTADCTAIPPAVHAAILAGGRSSRYGRDKARAALHGTTLLRRAATTLPEIGALAVVAPRPYAELRDLGAVWLRDPVPGAGPLAGVVAALRWARRDGGGGGGRGSGWVLVRAVDLPWADARLWRALLAARGARPAVVPTWTTPSGAGAPRDALEPLAALWHVRALPALERDLAAGRRALHGALERLRPIRVPARALRAAAGPRAFVNVNRPADLRPPSSGSPRRPDARPAPPRQSPGSR